MVDNLFVVESPLQALIALELSIRFKDEKNGVIYRFVEGRERNNQQIEKVLNKGYWNFRKEILFDHSSGFANHKSIVRELNLFKKKFPKGVSQLFIGEFRSQWMHFMRVAVLPVRTILIDDGAATLTVKREFIDRGIYFPEALWKEGGVIKKCAKRLMYRRFIQKQLLQSPLYLASAFIKSESLYPIDFSALKENFKNCVKNNTKRCVFFFGSKYSESGIVAREYELNFLAQVKEFYSSYECDLVYCSHRDESDEKLSVIKDVLGFDVLSSDSPAEIFLLENSHSIVEVSGAYSSVLNNAKILFPEIEIRAFQLASSKISLKYRENIELLYEHFNKDGINVVS